eukprot:3200241-Pleurochrysis_carterae.AAC.1
MLVRRACGCVLTASSRGAPPPRPPPTPLWPFAGLPSTPPLASLPLASLPPPAPEAGGGGSSGPRP